MSLSGSKIDFNWKYIFREVLLIFIGINLAIWFNNWNSSRKIKENKELAISKIVDEIENNAKEIELTHQSNQNILNAFADYNSLYRNSTSELVAKPSDLSLLSSKYPGFFRIRDSVAVKNGMYQYEGTTTVQLELPVLSEIAWETTRNYNVTNKFNYDCLYDLESMYDLQQLMKSEMDKAADALQNRNLDLLKNILGFLVQIDQQLMDSYKNMLATIEDCR